MVLSFKKQSLQMEEVGNLKQQQKGLENQSGLAPPPLSSTFTGVVDPLLLEP